MHDVAMLLGMALDTPGPLCWILVRTQVFPHLPPRHRTLQRRVCPRGADEDGPAPELVQGIVEIKIPAPPA
jgi:hypothetical protein